MEKTQNHNFANWELTQFLPEINPYNSTKAIDSMGYEQLVTVCESMLSPEQWRYLWSWEDIRLYLKDNGCYFETQKQLSFESYIVSISHGKDLGTYLYKSEYQEPFESYEEARIEAIKYCLSLITEKANE